jgi:murein L,D-transpeptidase YcbB/YkuD
MKTPWLIAAFVFVSNASALGKQQDLPYSPSRLSLTVNIPAFRLDVIRDGEVIGAYDVAAGTRKYRTPTGKFTADRITWNPWWYPPKSYWARHEKITRPGPTNPMGKVKISLGGFLYAHATPFAHTIGSAASHGCLRMRPEDAVSLAIWLEDEAGTGLDARLLENLLAVWDSTYEVPLRVPVPVDVVYELVEMRLDTLVLYPDIYRQGANSEPAVLAVLSRAGIDTTSVDRKVVRTMLRRSRSAPVRIIARELSRVDLAAKE